jgi:acetoacetate decarboxylase
MPFRQSDDKVKSILRRFSEPHFTNAQILQVDFRTTEAAAESVLPPGFSPVEGLRCYARVGRWTSNCVGNFDGGSLCIEAEHAGQRGYLVLAMYMDTATSIIFGRDLFGEPKRPAEAAIYRTASGWYGSVERYGTTIIEIELSEANSLGPADTSGATFNVKSVLAADGSGLDGDAVVTRAAFENHVWARYSGGGRVELRDTPHDPMSDLVVDEVLGATYAEGQARATVSTLGSIPGAEFLPFALARIDDPTVLVTSH